jgi:hypothetical protein
MFKIHIIGEPNLRYSLLESTDLLLMKVNIQYMLLDRTIS